MAETVTKAIDGQDQYTDSLHIKPPRRVSYLLKPFSLSVSGTFVATVFIQRSFDETNWHDVASYTTPTEDAGFEPVGASYRVGVKTGGYTSGTVNVRLSA